MLHLVLKHTIGYRVWLVEVTYQSVMLLLTDITSEHAPRTGLRQEFVRLLTTEARACAGSRVVEQQGLY